MKFDNKLLFKSNPQNCQKFSFNPKCFDLAQKGPKKDIENYRPIANLCSTSKIFEKLIRKGVPVRRLGSAAIDLCWVAAGRFDGFYEHKLQAWDSAAGFLIVEEAGGMVTDFAGNPYSPYQPHIIATNGKIHNELVAVVNGGEVAF